MCPSPPFNLPRVLEKPSAQVSISILQAETLMLRELNPPSKQNDGAGAVPKSKKEDPGWRKPRGRRSSPGEQEQPSKDGATAQKKRGTGQRTGKNLQECPETTSAAAGWRGRSTLDASVTTRARRCRDPDPFARVRIQSPTADLRETASLGSYSSVAERAKRKLNIASKETRGLQGNTPVRAAEGRVRPGHRNQSQNPDEGFMLETEQGPLGLGRWAESISSSNSKLLFPQVRAPLWHGTFAPIALLFHLV